MKQKAARRGDTVTVTHLSFDNRELFQIEDEKLMRQIFMRRVIIISLLSLLSLFVLALVARAVQKELFLHCRGTENSGVNNFFFCFFQTEKKKICLHKYLYTCGHGFGVYVPE